MSKVIDEKVVSLKLDNSNFEDNAVETLKTVYDLKKGLDFNGSEKGFEVLSNATETVKLKFSALEIAAITAISNITNRAIDAGERIIKSLSIDNISAGWEKFGDKTVSVGTLISQGYDLEEVNEQLDRLNWFTDETSYNFTDMVSNIAKFTATGKDLETSVTAMEGIANWAALSGQNAQTASRAMYQISQAMGAGVMRLEDYKSIQNASMDTDEFRQKALEAAVELGTLKKVGKDTYQSLTTNSKAFTKTSFTTSLTEGQWFTSDVMMKVFNDYSAAVDQIYELSEEKGLTASEVIEEMGDQIDEFGLKAFKAAQEARTWGDVLDSVKDAVSTGWMNTFELVIGDYEEAKTFFTAAANELYDVFAESGNQRNEVLGWWKEQGGRDLLFEALGHGWESLRNVIDAVKQGFRDVFPAMTGERLLKFTLRLNLLSEKLVKIFRSVEVDGEETNTVLIGIRNTVSGFFSIIKIGLDLFGKLISAVIDIAKHLTPIAKALFNVSSSFGEYLSNLGKTIEESAKFDNILELIVKVLGNVIDKVIELGSAIGKSAGNAGTFFSPIFGGLIDLFKRVGNTAFEAAKNIIQAFGRGAGGKFDFSVLLGNVNKILEALALLKGNKILQKVTEILGPTKNPFKAIAHSISEVFEDLGDAIRVWQQSVKVDMLLKIAIALTLLAAALAILSGIDKDKLNQSVGVLTVLLGEMVAATKTLAMGVSTGGISKMAILISFATSILVLTAAVKVLASMEFDAMLNGLVGVGLLLAMLTGMTAVLGKIGGRVTKGALGIVILSSAVVILASVVKELGSIPWDNMQQGLLGVGILLGMIDAFLLTTKMSGMKAITTATGVIIIAAALNVLCQSVTYFGTMSFDSLQQGLIGIGLLLTEIAIFTRILYPPKKIISVGLAMVLICEALNKIIPVFEALGKMDLESIEKAVLAIGVTVLTLAVASKNTKLVGTASLVVLIDCLKTMSDVFIKMQNISWTTIKKSLVVIGAMLTMFAISTRAIKSDAMVDAMAITMVVLSIAHAVKQLSTIGLIEGAIGLGIFTAAMGLIIGSVAVLSKMTGKMMKVSASIVTFSLSITVFSAAIAVLGTGLLFFATGLTAALLEISVLNWGDVAKGILVLVGAITIFGVSAKLLKPLTGSILSLALTLLMLSAACIGIAIAIDMVISGITALAYIGPEGAKSIGMVLREVIIAVSEALPYFVKGVGDSIVEIIRLLKNSSVEIIQAVVVVIGELLVALHEIIPDIVLTVLDIINELLDGLIEYGPQIIDKLITVFILVIDGLANRMPELVNAAARFIKVFIDAIALAMQDVDTENLTNSMVMFGIVAIVAKLLAGLTPIIGSAMAGAVAAAGLIGEIAILIAAIGALNYIPGFQELVESGGELLYAVGEAIGAFFGGLVGGLIEGVASNLPELGTYLSQFAINMMPFLMNIKLIDPQMLENVAILTGIILGLTVAEMIDAVAGWITGGNSLEDFAKELVPFGEAMVQFSNTVSGNINEDAVKAAASAGEMMVALAKDVPNSGGILSFIMGDNKLDDFGEQLVAFGTSIVAFSQSLTDESGNSLINTGAVEAAASAGEMMIAMAKDIPNSGGILGFIMGNNDLDKFGEQLASFGTSIAEFSASIVDENGNSLINLEAVDAVATAGKIMTEMAKDVPNSGGILSFIMGDNKLDTWGEQLEAFATSIVNFSNTVTDENGNSAINQNAIQAAADAGSILTKLAEEVPNSGGLIDFFTGKNDLGTFGDHLKQFGEGLNTFGKLVELIDGYQLALVIAQVERLVDLAVRMEDIDTSGMRDFSDNLTDLGDFGIDNFIKAFDNAKTRVQTAAKNMVTTFTKEVINYKSEMVKAYTELMANGAIKTLESYSDEHETTAKKLMASFRSGAYSVSSLTSKVYTGMLDSVITAMEKYASKFSDTGKLLTEGLAKGMEDNQDLVKTAAENLVKVANDTVVEKSEINSPSKLFRRLGKFIPEGFALGIEDETSSVIRAIDYLTDTAYDETINTFENLNDVLSSGAEITPVVAPIYDPSNLNVMTSGLMRNIDTEVTRPVMSLSNQILDAQSRIEDSNNRVIESINQLGQNIREFADAQDKEINLYADTTKLASSIAKPLDRQLEAIAKRRR